MNIKCDAALEVFRADNHKSDKTKTSMHHDASTGNTHINGTVVTPRRKRRRVSIPDIEGHTLTERLSVMQIVNEKSDAAIENGLVKG